LTRLFILAFQHKPANSPVMYPVYAIPYGTALAGLRGGQRPSSGFPSGLLSALTTLAPEVNCLSGNACLFSQAGCSSVIDGSCSGTLRSWCHVLLCSSGRTRYHRTIKTVSCISTDCCHPPCGGQCSAAGTVHGILEFYPHFSLLSYSPGLQSVKEPDWLPKQPFRLFSGGPAVSGLRLHRSGF